MGLTPDRPARRPAVNSDTPVPMLVTAPMPVMTTRGAALRRTTARSSDSLGRTGSARAGLGDDGVDTLEVDHPAQLGLVDGDAERALEGGQDLDRAQRVGVVVLLEQARRADLGR